MNKTPCILGFAILLLMSGCSTLGRQGTSSEESVFIGAAPIVRSQAFQNFLNSSRTEKDKLGYLLDRIRESRGLSYIYDGDRYTWIDAHAVGNWLLWHRYKRGERASSFLKREAGPDPARQAYIRRSDGTQALAYVLLTNELLLLDDTLKKIHFLLPAQTPLTSKHLEIGMPLLPAARQAAEGMLRLSMFLLQEPVSRYTYHFPILPDHQRISGALAVSVPVLKVPDPVAKPSKQ